MHPHVSQALTSERIKGWQEEAARERLAKEARRAQRGRRGRGTRRGWGIRRTRMPVTDVLAPPPARPVPPGQPVTGPRGAAAGWPSAADERRPVGAGGDGRRPAGTRAA